MAKRRNDSSGKPNLGPEKDDELERSREEVLHLKASLLSNISHELRTPLHTILATVEVLRQGIDGTLSPDQRRSIDIIDSHANRLLNSVGALLDYTRISSLKAVPRPRLLDLGSVVSSIAGTYKDRCREKGITFEAAVDGLPSSFRQDEDLVRMVLQQLLDNAVKFTPSGKRVWLKGSGIDSVTFEVGDEGVGIDEKSQALVAQGFIQEDSGASRKFEGIGLGLGLVRRAIELLRGTWSLRSSPGAGTVIEVSIPPSTERVSYKILVIDDEPILGDHLKAVLEAKGHAVEVSRGGDAALRSVATTTPDLILLDCMMPGISGSEVLTSIRKKAWGRGLPVIMMSAIDEPKVRAEAFQHGADDFIVKPFSLDEVLARIERAVTFRGKTR